MVKKTKTEATKKADAAPPAGGLFGSSAKVDASLASLFATKTTPEPTLKDKSKSKGDKVLHAKSSKDKKNKKKAAHPASVEDEAADEAGDQNEDDDLSSIDEEFDDEASVSEAESGAGDRVVPSEVEESETKSRRKRKRDDEDLEGKYMDKLAKEEEKEDAKRAAERQSKRQKSSAEPSGSKPEINGADADSDAEMTEDKSESEEEEEFEVPQHESLAQTPDQEIEKANRTVFLGNVSSDAVTTKKSKKALVQHMSSFLDAMNTGGGKDDKKKKDEKADEKHKFESIRFRSTAYTNMLPKKASFVTQDLMDSTTKSTNAYVVYSTQAASRAALKLNGTTVLGRHLRVDSVAHPSKSDPKRCVFVGNLGFVDDDSAIQAADAEESKKKPRKRTPSDIEEGLWREFGKCGAVENVRVVRDSKTRIGKGIAYVQFMGENSVEAALLYNDKRFPPLLPRKLRVSRAKGIKRNVAKQNTWSRPATNGVYNPKISEQQKSAMGRASKLLGRAGAAMMDKSGTSIPKLPAKASDLKAPESFVFEGHRATRGSGTAVKKASAGKKKGRPDNRSSRRAKEWKFGGGDK